MQTELTYHDMEKGFCVVYSPAGQGIGEVKAKNGWKVGDDKKVDELMKHIYEVGSMEQMLRFVEVREGKRRESMDLDYSRGITNKAGVKIIRNALQ